MIGRIVLVAFVDLAGLVTAQVVTAQNGDPKTEKAQRFKVRGRVVDENDDAVQGVLIRVEAARSAGPLAAQRFPAFTDDHGEFRLSLGPGEYYIVASPIAGMDNHPEIRTDGSFGDPYGPAVRAFAPGSTGPGALCSKLNEVLCGSIAPGKFVTLFYGVIDSERSFCSLRTPGTLRRLCCGETRRQFSPKAARCWGCSRRQRTRTGSSRCARAIACFSRRTA